MSDSEEIFLEDCRGTLVTQCPDSLTRSCQKINSLVRRVHDCESSGSALYQLTGCEEIDAGAILLLMHGGYRIGRAGWRACVTGEGEAINLMGRHLEHYLRARKDRAACEREEGDYLLREISDPSVMVPEISEWAASVQQETSAAPEEVAIWKFQMSEVTTNGFQHGLGDTETPAPLLLAGKSSSDARVVQLAALDHGNTIPQTIAAAADRANIPDHDGKRIAFACKKGVTSRRLRVNQGAGLFKLVQTVKQNGGRLLVLSRNGLFHVSGGRCYNRLISTKGLDSPVLEGTLMVANLRVR